MGNGDDYANVLSALLAGSLDVRSVGIVDGIDDVGGLWLLCLQSDGGVLRLRRVSAGLLRDDVSTALSDLRSAVSRCMAATSEAEDARDSALLGASSARSAAIDASSMVDSASSRLDDYLSDVDSNTRRRLAELASMSEHGELSGQVDSVQLYEDFKRLTGYEGSYEGFVSLLGSGGGGSGVIDSELSETSERAVQNKVVKRNLDGKQNLLGWLTTQDVLEMMELVGGVDIGSGSGSGNGDYATRDWVEERFSQLFALSEADWEDVFGE